MYDELVKRLRERAEAFDYDGWVVTASDYGKAADAIEELQKALADAHNEFANKSEESEEKVGHWIEHEDDWWGNYWECSNCHDEYSIIEGEMYYKHCPGCGAKMECVGVE